LELSTQKKHIAAFNKFILINHILDSFNHLGYFSRYGKIQRRRIIMSKKRLIEYAIIVFLVLPLVAFAETQGTQEIPGTQEIRETKEIQGTKGTKEIREHKVIKGDTLWGISKIELNDPLMWPAIWKENPNIANPRWIYPGQIIKIPLSLIQSDKKEEEALPKPETVSQEPATKEVTQEVKKEVQVIKHPLVNNNIIMGSGYIAETIPVIGQVCDCPPEQKVSDKTIAGVGQVDESPSGYTVHGNEDIVYVNVNSPAKVGDKFYVINVSEPVYHPITGAKVGYVITICGILEIVEVKNGDTMAKVTKSFREINQGDILDTYYDIKSPMTTGDFRRPDINGMIVASADTTMIKAMSDIVYIDRGCKDGVEAGDMFKTLAVDTHAVTNGTIQVISCKDHTATAIIQNSIAPIVPGNIFAKLEKIEKKADAAVKKDQPAGVKENTTGAENSAAKEAVN
jgi:hypothetical protein